MFAAYLTLYDAHTGFSYLYLTKISAVKAAIPVYDIVSIDQYAWKDLLIERFGGYLEKYYSDLHTSHRHSFYHLVMFTAGEGSHTIDFEKFAVEPYQVYFMIPGQVHSWHFSAGVDGYIIHFNKVLFTSFLQDSEYLHRFHFFSGNVKDCVCRIPSIHQEKIGALFEGILMLANDSIKKNLDLIRLRLLELFIRIDQFRLNKEPPDIRPQKLIVLRNFQLLVDKNFRTIKLPKEYAQLLNITPNHLNALTHELLGKTAGSVIRERILLEAKRFLTNANMSIAEIAYDLNFQDNSYFNRFFKKYEHITPDEFRKGFVKK